MAAILSALGNFMLGAIKWILKILLVVAFIAIIYPLLPDDPFRGKILEIRGTFGAFEQLFNWCLPVGFITTSILFWACCELFYVIYKIVARAIGIEFTSTVTGCIGDAGGPPDE